MSQNQVFVSYAHADADFLRRLQIHLRPFERQGRVDLWADTKIQAGDKWKAEIAEAIEKASAAVLLISADFLASEFIAANELPPLLKAAEERDVKILPVVLKPCAFTDIDELAQFQAFNDPQQPVSSMNHTDAEDLWYQVSRTIGQKINITPPPQPETPDGPNNEPPSTGDTLDYMDYYFELYWEELLNPNVVKEFSVYSYHFLDNLSFAVNAEQHLKRFPTCDILIKNIKTHFENHGWEGDGDIQLIWLPPFVGAGVEDTSGLCVWHVKQSNNGTSWIASPVPLPFKRLLEQN